VTDPASLLKQIDGLYAQVARRDDEIERLTSALRQIELNTRTGDPLTLKLNWLSRAALSSHKQGEA